MFWKKKNAPPSWCPEDDVRITEMHIEGSRIYVTAVYKDKVYIENTYLCDYASEPERVVARSINYLKTVAVNEYNSTQWWGKVKETVAAYPVATR